MRRGFTLIELIFSMVIIAIVASVGTDVIRLVFERYVASRDLERGQSDVRRTLDLLAARLQYRVKNSVIGRNPDTNETRSLNNLPLAQPSPYTVLEWVGVAYESRRGMDDGAGTVQAGWSGLGIKQDENRTVSPGSFFRTVAQPIEDNLTGNANPFENNMTILIYAGSQLRGDYTGDQNESWGWNPADRNSSYFSLGGDYNDTDFNLTALQDDNDTVPASDQYYLARSAYAVWVNDGNLTLAYDYRPWRGQSYTTATQSVLLENVTLFQFQETSGALRLVLCVKASDAVAGNNDDNSTQFCRERTVL